MLSVERAAEVQRELSSRLVLEWGGKDVSLVAGADFAYDGEKRRIGASIAVYRIPDFCLVETSESVRAVRFDYIPGFLSYREGPAFIQAFKKIKNKPDVTLIDGNGIAHPRKMGLASFVGVTLEICTVGCAKTPFYPYVLPMKSRGSYTFFRNEGREKVGICLRTRRGVKPIFVSPGHKIDFLFARELVLRCSKFRIPEPLREAHSRARRLF